MIEFRTALRRVRAKNGGDFTILRPVSANNIAQSLRMLADSIEEGTIVAETLIAVASNGNDTAHWHWGKWDYARNAGLLQRVANEVAQGEGE